MPSFNESSHLMEVYGVIFQHCFTDAISGDSINMVNHLILFYCKPKDLSYDLRNSGLKYSTLTISQQFCSS
jgi:hypothetical protein